MSSFGNAKKRRQQSVMSSRLKQVRGVAKPVVQDIYPFPIGNSQSISSEVKHYINELQREYIERYNVLINNRIIYEDLIQNISTELDQKGVTTQKLEKLYKNFKSLQNKQKIQQES